jgi:hypothetical protein
MNDNRKAKERTRKTKQQEKRQRREQQREEKRRETKGSSAKAEAQQQIDEPLRRIEEWRATPFSPIWLVSPVKNLR